MLNDYSPVAKWYDFLNYLVFGDAPKNVQRALLRYIKPDSRILIVGGGTGWILEEITKLHPATLDITYVEVSRKMIDLSQLRHTGQNKVRFINSPIEDVSFTDSFDIVFTAFLFDNFKAQRAAQVFALLHQCLCPGGYWFFADFSISSASAHWWQKSLLDTMYLFFRLICRVEAKQLIDMRPFFSKETYSTLSHTEACKGFIYSEALQKAY